MASFWKYIKLSRKPRYGWAFLLILHRFMTICVVKVCDTYIQYFLINII